MHTYNYIALTCASCQITLDMHTVQLLHYKWYYTALEQTSLVTPGWILPDHHAIPGSLIPPSYVVPFPHLNKPWLPPSISPPKAGLWEETTNQQECINTEKNTIQTRTHYLQWKILRYFGLLLHSSKSQRWAQQNHPVRSIEGVATFHTDLTL